MDYLKRANVEQKKPDTKEYILCDSVYVKYKNRMLVTVKWEGNNWKKVWELRLLGWWYVLWSISLFGCWSCVCVQLWKFTKLYICNIYTFLWSYCVWVYSCELEGEKTPRMSVSKMLISFLTFLLNSVNVHILKLWKNMIMNYSLKCFWKTSWNIFWYCLRI